MITLHSLEQASAALGAAGGTVLTWGTFDGMHRGHQALIASARAKAEAMNLPLLVLTFEPCPAAFFNPDRAPRSIADLEDRLSLLKRLGADYSLVLPFERSLAAMEAEEFLHGLVLGRLKARGLVLGYDLSFGSRGLGDYDFLRSRATGGGFSLETIAPLRLGPSSRVISSTWVRERLAAGDLAGLPPLLGRQHSVHGQVLHGYRRGRGLGFATANLNPGPLLLPPPGTYACLASGLARPGIREDNFAAAACNLGTNPSFGNGDISLEAHLLDFSGDIYGRDLRLYFIKKLRAETAFPSQAALARQISLDVLQTREIIGAARRDPAFAELYPL